jgi:hypothetical protein
MKKRLKGSYAAHFRSITTAAWPCGVMLRLRQLVPAPTSALRTAATGQ